MAWPVVENFRRLPLRTQITAVAVTLAVVNAIAFLVLLGVLHGNALTGRVVSGHYFVEENRGARSAAYVHYNEVSRAAFTASLVVGSLFCASAVVTLLFAYAECFKDARPVKAKRAAASDITTKGAK